MTLWLFFHETVSQLKDHSSVYPVFLCPVTCPDAKIYGDGSLKVCPMGISVMAGPFRKIGKQLP